MSLHPLSDHVLIRRIEEEMTPGGLYRPLHALEKSTVGEVLAVGPGCELPSGVRMPPEVRPGDKVLFSKYGVGEVEIDGMRCQNVHEGAVFGVFTETSMRPLRNRILFRRVMETEIQKDSLIVLPENRKERLPTCLGDVVAVGSGKVLDSGIVSVVPVAVGERVVVDRSTVEDVVVNNEKMLLVDADNILGTVDA